MVPEFVLRCRLTPVLPVQEILLSTGEIVRAPYIFSTRRLIDGHYANPTDDLFYVPLKPVDYYIAEVSIVAVRFTFTEEHLIDERW